MNKYQLYFNYNILWKNILNVLNILLESLFQSNHMYTLFGYVYSSIFALFKVSKFSMTFDGLTIYRRKMKVSMYLLPVGMASK